MYCLDCCARVTSYCYVAGEGITPKSFLLLTDGDLKELGFNIGCRRVLLQWISEQRSKSVQLQPEAVVLESPVQQQSPQLPRTPSQAMTPQDITPRASASRVTSFKVDV